MNKYLVTAILFGGIFFMSAISAGTYIEYKNELPILNLSLMPTVGEQTHHIRIGEEVRLGGITMYIEAGGMTNGYSYETGYKYKKGNWTIKGKYEGKDSGFTKSKLQTEIRYNF